MSTAIAAAPISATDEALVALWADHVLAARRHHLTFQELADQRLRLGELLARKRAELAAVGCHGQFDPWLRQHNIPRTTAYRLIHAWENQGIRTTGTVPAVALRRQTLTLHLAPREAVFFHRALAALAALDQPTELALLLARALLPRLPQQARRDLDNLLDTPPSRFTPADLATSPPLKFTPSLRPILVGPPKSS